MFFRVIADLKSGGIERFDLLPSHVVFLVDGEFKTLSDEKGGNEAVFF